MRVGNEKGRRRKELTFGIILKEKASGTPKKRNKMREDIREKVM